MMLNGKVVLMSGSDVIMMSSCISDIISVIHTDEITAVLELGNDFPSL